MKKLYKTVVALALVAAMTPVQGLAAQSTKLTVEQRKMIDRLYIGTEDSDTPTLYPGQNKALVAPLAIKEENRGDWLAGEDIEIVFPEGIKIYRYTQLNKKVELDVTVEDTGNSSLVTLKKKEDVSSDRETFRMTYYLTVSPSFVGDIYVEVKSKNSEETEKVYLGCVEMPLSVTANSNTVSDKEETVKLDDIEIKEVDKGFFKATKTISLKIDGYDFTEKPDVEVINGNGKIDSVKLEEGILTIKFKEPSADGKFGLLLTGAQAKANEDAQVGKHALLLVEGENDLLFDGESAKAFSQEGLIVKENLIFLNHSNEISTNVQNKTVMIPIGQNKIVADGKEIAVDVPAYISGGYTLVPLRAISEGLSAEVLWNAETKTATILYSDKVIVMTEGSNTATVNDVPFTLMKSPEIKNGRMFIPFRDLGLTLGYSNDSITWNDSTKTAIYQ